MRSCLMSILFENNTRWTQKQAVEKKVFFFIGVTVRLQSRDIQVIDSDTLLCTQRFYTEEVKHLQDKKKTTQKKHVKGGAR